MATTTWTGSSGNWTDPTWSNGVPNATLDAIIAGTSSNLDTVTFNTPSGAAHSLSMAFATLAMAGGTLTLENASSLSALDQIGETGGLIDFAAGGTISGPLSQDTGTIEIDSGTLLAEGTSFLGGMVEGPGTLLVSGTAEVDQLTANGGVVINDTGFISQDGWVHLAFASGTDQATLAIAAGGTWDITTSQAQFESSGTASIINAGLFEMTSGDGYDDIVVTDFTSTGTISVIAGSRPAGLSLDGRSVSLGGTIGGSGRFELAGGGTATLQSGLALTVADFVVTGGNVVLGGNFSPADAFMLDSGATLLLNGNTFTAGGTLPGSQFVQLDGVVEGPGTLLVSGIAYADGLVTQGNLTILDTGQIDQGGNVFLAHGSSTDQATVAIAADGTWDMDDTSNFQIVESGTATITNAGLFEKIGGTAPGLVEASFTNTGTVLVTAGTLMFDGASFTDTGLVDASGGDIIFKPGVSDTNLSAGTLTDGTWEAVAGTLAITGGTIATDDATIILSGSGSELAAGTGLSFTPIEQSLTAIAAAGTLDLENARGCTATNAITDQGLIALGGGTFSDTSMLAIAAGGTFSGSGTLSAAAISNAGSLVAAAGSTLVVTGPVTGEGALVAAGTLDLTGTGNVINASILGSGLLEFGGGSTTIDRGISGHISRTDLLAGATLTMGFNAAYDGTFTDTATGGTSTLDLASHEISLARASFTGSSGGTALIDGGGTLTNIGTMTLNGAALDGGTALSNSKLIKQSASLALGDASGGTASIVNNKGATYDITNAVSLSAASATADTIANAGLFEKTGSGTAVVGAAFTNTGTIEVTSGTLEITAAFTNTGTIIGTEMQSNGTTFITAPSASVFNQYAAAMDSPGGSAALAPPPPAPIVPTLAAAHAA